MWVVVLFYVVYICKLMKYFLYDENSRVDKSSLSNRKYILICFICCGCVSVENLCDFGNLNCQAFEK